MHPFTHAFPVLAVSNLDTALAFYTERLGFQLDWRSGDHTAVVGNGVISVFLKTTDAGGLGPASVILNVEDADAVFSAWRDAVVSMLDTIATKPWGMRELTAEDLDGNALTVGQVDESEADYGDFIPGPDEAAGVKNGD